MLLPVRDEEHNVLDCVDTLLAQTARPLVRVIDDGSTDATADLVRGRAASEPRLSLRAAGPLPEGWPGKVHALAAGARDLGTPWLLVTDADTRHHPDLLARARAAAEERRLDAVSVAGRQEARGPGEELLVPAVFALLDALLGDWEAVADSGGAPVANGQFLLIRRKAWERAGGFASVRSAPIDDVATAQRLRAGGGRTGFFRAPDLLSIRMYRGLREAAGGWRRNLGGIFGPQPKTAGICLAVLAGPPLVLALQLATGRRTEAAAFWAAGAAASAVFRAGSGNSPLYGLLYPCDALLLAGLLGLGVWDRKRGGPVRWKGRVLTP